MASSIDFLATFRYSFFLSSVMVAYPDYCKAFVAAGFGLSLTVSVATGSS
jgi:hypothetical protein